MEREALKKADAARREAAEIKTEIAISMSDVEASTKRATEAMAKFGATYSTGMTAKAGYVLTSTPMGVTWSPVPSTGTYATMPPPRVSVTTSRPARRPATWLPEDNGFEVAVGVGSRSPMWTCIGCYSLTMHPEKHRALCYDSEE